MVKNAFHVAIRNGGSLVFLVVVISGLVMSYVRAVPPLNSQEVLLLLLLSVVYTIVGTLVFWMVIASGSVKCKILYLSLQFVLGMSILHLARGNGWLVMLPIVSHSVVLFSPREAVIPCVLVLLGISWNTSQMMEGWVPFFQSAVIFSSLVVFSAIFTNIAMSEARAREETERLAAQLAQANRELQENAAKMEELAAIKERNRMAREIHDGLGHYLTAMNMQSKVVSELIGRDPDRARKAIDRLQGMILSALADVRHSVAALRSDDMAGKHVPASLIPLIDESCQSGVATELTVQGEARPLPPALEWTIFRAVQEGLTNIQKHASAARVMVRLKYEPQEISLEVEDDGRGMESDPAGIRSGYGLLGLRERVSILGGNMDIDTRPGAGFRFRIVLPENQEETTWPPSVS